MKYNYGDLSFRGSIPEIQGYLRKYLEAQSIYLRMGKIVLGLESMPIPESAECMDDLVEIMIKTAVYQVEQCANSLQYMNRVFHGSWNDIHYLLKPYLETLPLRYAQNGYFELGLLSVCIREDLTVNAIKRRLVVKILCECRDKYNNEYGGEEDD